MSDNIYEVLIAQHEAAKKALTELSGVPVEAADERRRLSQCLARDVISHNEAVLQTLYARLASFDELRGRMEGYRRVHDRLNKSLRLLLNLGADDPGWTARIEATREAFERHVAAEEGDLFVQARERLGAAEAKRLASEFVSQQDRRKNLMQPG